MKKTSNSEYIVMQAFWDNDGALNRYELADILSKPPYSQKWEVGTVSTFVSRLYAKGLIDYNRINKINQYYATVGKREYVRTIINQKLQTVFKTNIEELILAYAEADINEDNLAKVNNFIETL